MHVSSKQYIYIEIEKYNIHWACWFFDCISLFWIPSYLPCISQYYKRTSFLERIIILCFCFWSRTRWMGEATFLEGGRYAHIHQIHRISVYFVVQLPINKPFLSFAGQRPKATILKEIFFSFILLIHEGSHQEFQPSYDIFRRWCQGLFRPQVPPQPTLPKC